MLIRFFLVFSLILSLYCSSEKKYTYDEIFILKAILDNASKPQANPVTTCQSTMSAMQTCAATAPEFSLFTLTESIFAATISSNKYTTYSDYCSNAVINDPYKNMSNSVKECFFKCDSSYWQTRKNLNICNSAFSTMLTGSFSDTGTNSCKRNCTSATNNFP
jgi:hypothetical protein